MKKKILCWLAGHPRLFYWAQQFADCILPVRGRGNKVFNEGCLIRSKISVIGNNNKIYIAKGCVLRNCEFHVRGDNHIIRFGENSKVIEWGSFWCEGADNSIVVGTGTSLVSAHLCAQEHDTKILIGDDCMFSNNIQIRTSDSHPYYDMETKVRLNPGASVNIGPHVWICAKATIMKGVTIGEGSIVGYSSIVTKNVSPNSLVAGSPAKTIREHVCWSRK
ncbi:MAG: acyltransferase [Alistipes sp.]|nr:acyltransferase [Alistipes sp.]